MGSFSAIFKHDEDVVLKVPTLAMDTQVAHEAKILKVLEREDKPVDNLALVV